MKPNLKLLLLFLAALAFVAFTFTGCQTADGFGRDVEKLGEKIQD